MQLRQERTRNEIVEAALAVATETGAASLSLGEVARRVGMRTPSLYGYFPSKAALCDEIFARGWHELAAVMSPLYEKASEVAADEGLHERLAGCLAAFVGWALDHRAMSELMFWRPIQQWEPSSEAFAPAVELVESLGRVLGRLQDRGLLRAEADVEEMTSVVNVLGAGVVSQQLSNEPGVPLERGRHSRHLDRLVEMFLRQYAAPPRQVARRKKKR